MKTPKDPKCLKCGGPLKRVTQSANSMLNRDQWEASIAGNWYCTTCPGDRAGTGYRYFWDHELIAAEPYEMTIGGE